VDGNYPVGNCSNQYYICIDGEMYPEVRISSLILEKLNIRKQKYLII